MEETMNKILNKKYDVTLSDADKKQIYNALMDLTAKRMKAMPENQGERKLYYISAEFLIGKLLSNNLINLGLYDEVKNVLAKYGVELSEIEELEPEPSLGNGGLGRLAACFLDSIATLGLPGDGVGLNYHMGLFRQVFRDHKQQAEINPWIEAKSWLKDTGVSFEVPFKDFTLKSKMYDITVSGYQAGTNKLHLFDVETVDESIIEEGINFDKTKIEKNLTLFLYPDDSDKAGNLLRVYQQYFMVSNAAQLILRETKERGYELKKLHKHVAVQINDTHPSMVIPELIRLLMEEGMKFKKAAKIVKKTCAYTNHTILAEALEKWPLEYIEQVAPQLVPIIKKLDAKVRKKYDDPRVQIIDEQGRVHMAHMDIHFGYSVNGVAYLHTEILKNEELKPFYDLYPKKFNNKTNGITFRRWLLYANPELTSWIEERIGSGFKKDEAELEKLLDLELTEEDFQSLLAVKQGKKEELAAYLKRTQGLELDPNSVFDIQIKRLHEYKRQQMNALYVIWKYMEIKAGKKPVRPITVIFGAKAAPAYIIAKDIIHLILCLQELIDHDPEVAPYLKVIMVENYNVTLAEKLIPACDISEQISLASKEASGTGNMKFMLNGAITLGTEDGANVEIHQLVGDENIYIFGEESQTVIDHYKNADYSAVDFFVKDEEIRNLVNFIISPELLSIGDKEMLLELHAELIRKDWFMTLLDLKAYIEKKEEVLADFEDRVAWSRKMLVNIAKAGFFSSDRTIAQYNEDIWKL